MGGARMWRAAALGVAALATIGLAGCDLLDPSEQLAVTTTADGSDADPGDGVCEVTVGVDDCSLRAAVDEANANAAITYIGVPSGTYLLSGDGDDTNTAGDLDLDPASGHLLVTATAAGVVVDADGGAGALDVRTGTVITTGISVTGSSGTGAIARSGAALTVLLASAFDNDGPGVAIEAGASGQVLSSTVAGNGVGVRFDGSALASPGDATVRSTTITGNGSGVFLGDGRDATIVGSSIVDNAGELVEPTDYDVRAVNSFVHVRGSVIGGEGYSPCVWEGSTQFLTEGHNTVVFGFSCFFEGVGDQVVDDALLGPLTDNGGPVRTRLPQIGSPVIDQIPVGSAGLCDGSLPIDQRGITRPQGPACDAGSVERHAGDPG